MKKPTPPSNAPTFKSIVQQWTSGELAAAFPDYVSKKRSWRADRYRAKHVPEAIQAKPLSTWTIDTYEEVMRSLPKTLGPSTRRQVAQLLHRVFELAVFPLRHVKANPIPRLPRSKNERALAVLYPADAKALAAQEKIDLGERVLDAFLVENGWRISQCTGRKEPKTDDGEDQSIPPLRWRDVDFDHDRAFLHQTKTTEAVEIPLDPPTLYALKAWRRLTPKSEPGDRVFVSMDGKAITVKQAAARFRERLQLAGITRETRADLFPEGDEKKRRCAVRIHDLRSLFVTASLAQDKPERWVRDRTLQSAAMLDRYRRNVPHFKKFGPLVPMVEAIPELAAAFAAIERGHSGGAAEPEIEASPNDCEQFRRKDSNLDKRIQNPLSCH